MRKYSVWLEGYSATGEQNGADYLGASEGNTFQEACQNLVAKLGWSRIDYNAEYNSYWGCRFYDNETDARKSFR